MPRSVLPLLILAALSACAASQPTLLPDPDPLPAGTTFSFGEWLPGGSPAYIEGQVVVGETGYQVSTRQLPCRQLPGLPTSAIQEFACGQLTLAFTRHAPAIIGVVRFTATVAEPAVGVCIQRQYSGGGGYSCAQSQVVHSYRTEVRSSRIRLNPVE